MSEAYENSVQRLCKERDTLNHRIKLLIEKDAIATARVRQLEEELRSKDGPCYYCGKPTSSWSGNPSLWAIPLCHEDDPGVSKPHHIGCVTERLSQRDELEAEVKRLKAGGCARDQRTTQFCAEAVALQTRCDELEKALRPFAQAADRVEPYVGTENTGILTGNMTEIAGITYADIYQARAALGKGAVDSAPQSAHTPNKEKT